jgi:hypothetical protein
MGQVAAQAQEEARRRLLSSAGDPGRARRLAAVLRTLAEAAGAGAREGRARLAMELLAVDSLDAARPVLQARPTSQARPSPEPMPVNPVRVDLEPAQPLPVATPPVHAAADPAPAAPSEAAAAAPAPAAVVPATNDAAPGDVAGVRARWATVVDAASPAIKPLLRECRPVALDGVRLTLAFPEERRFMREKAATRAGAIESLLGEIMGGSWAIDCIASNVELEPLTVVQAVAPDPADPDAAALLEGVLRITGGELVDVPEVR